MFERFTQKARRTIFFARYEASQFAAPEISTEHLLLGLLREHAALAPPGSAEKIRQEIERDAPRGVRPVSAGADIPLTHSAKRVLAYAAEEADGLAHPSMGAAHLLLGLLREHECPAALALERHGVTLAYAREQARLGLDTDSPQPAPDHSGLVAESRRQFHGHEIRLVERARLSEDGKTLHYSIDIHGPNASHSFSADFQVPPAPRA